MTEIRAIGEGFIIMVILIIVGIIMSLAMGGTIDQMYDAFYTTGCLDVSEGWDTTTGQNAIINIAHYWYMFLPILGVLIFLATIVHTYMFRREDPYDQQYRRGL